MQVTSMESLFSSLEAQQDELILEQLGDLVKKGLLVCESGPITVVQHPGIDFKYELRKSVRFVLKDKEHIACLEQENRELKERLNKLQEAISGVEL